MIKTIAFIPARKGTKGIHLKNIKEFCGKPLIWWVLKELSKVETIDEIVVATDSKTIANTVFNFKYTKVTTYDRDLKNAQDESPTIDVIFEYLNKNQEHVKDQDTFMLVQCTIPYTTSTDYSNGLKLYNDEFTDSVLSCCKFRRLLWNEKGIVQNYNPVDKPRRQDINTGLMLENGAFYINKVSSIKKEKTMTSGAVSIYEMPEYTSCDIDTEDDFYYAEYLMKKYRLNNELL